MSSSSNNNRSSANPTRKEFLFVVTGFGPFNGVPENPTSILIKELPSYVRQQQQDKGHSTQNPNDQQTLALLADHLHTILVETSAEAAAKEVQDLQRLLQDYKNAIILHLGVHGGSNTFRLEQCAYNDATFRVPDERGFQPTQQTVLPGLYEWGHTFTTSFNVPALVQHLNETCTTVGGTGGNDTNIATTQDASTAVDESSIIPTNPVANLSQDPGRFVCNYLYCSSLQAFDHATTTTANNNRPRPCVQSLFLHVPPFHIVPQADQLKFVTQTMLALYREQQYHSPTAQLPLLDKN